jgi:hypothetical protein
LSREFGTGLAEPATEVAYHEAVTKARHVVAIALSVGLVAGLTGIAGYVSGDLGRLGSSTSAPTPTRGPRPEGSNQAASSLRTVDEQGARISAAQDLVSARSKAVNTRDKSAWMAAVDASGSSFGRRQSLAFDNLMKLPIGRFAYGAVQLAPALAETRVQQLGSTAWVATVPGTYTLAGYDRAPRSFDATYTLVRRAGGWRIADDSDGATALQMWDLPGLRVLRGRSAIVIGNAPEVRMRDYQEIADTAVRRVTGVWGTDWNAHVVVVTPSTTKEFAGLLSRPADEGLDQVAAITEGEITPDQRAQGDRVVINPKSFTALRVIGRQVVITHELTHVATRSSTIWPVPLWLSEGLADYVGYSGLGLPRARVASELLALVRQGKGPKALPAADDFDPARTKIAPSYAAAWLAVSRLVDIFGQARVVAFYRAISDRPLVDKAVQFDPDGVAERAFPQSFGVSEAAFVDGWKRYLRTLALTPQ